MPSQHFEKLSSSILELKRIYLDAALIAGQPTPDQQELARAFVLTAHAEIEWFIEQVCADSAATITNQAINGKFNSSSLAFLTFSALEPMNGGDNLGKKGNGQRTLSSRFSAAHVKFKNRLEENEGAREKHLAKLTVPLGLNANAVDPTWLGEVDALCTYRGAFAHVSRLEARATHQTVNPADIWALCERVVWTNAQIGNGDYVTSFQGLDDWLQQACSNFGAVVITSRPPSFIDRMLKWMGRQ